MRLYKYKALYMTNFFQDELRVGFIMTYWYMRHSSWFEHRGETRALIGGGGVNIHIFLFCPTNFFWNQLSLRLISKEIRRAEHEYMNIHPPN